MVQKPYMALTLAPFTPHARKCTLKTVVQINSLVFALQQPKKNVQVGHLLRELNETVLSKQFVQDIGEKIVRQCLDVISELVEGRRDHRHGVVVK